MLCSCHLHQVTPLTTRLPLPARPCCHYMSALHPCAGQAMYAAQHRSTVSMFLMLLLIQACAHTCVCVCVRAHACALGLEVCMQSSRYNRGCIYFQHGAQCFCNTTIALILQQNNIVPASAVHETMCTFAKIEDTVVVAWSLQQDYSKCMQLTHSVSYHQVLPLE